ncbi:hypothetical protein ACPOL_5288 [Acidisarcina polymorpha]|uniref:Uncharacterized protein n=1 Tax=Acidisarcina polymorpha TaxID=2211140 RepID=A0A2Z5G617_9BACT|nr:hypothetical protein [Acidisarcina polymorpha]AXC14538.1 hypothetical protein ACPOL_5288 [Acidisarcina polymorpha]
MDMRTSHLQKQPLILVAFVTLFIFQSHAYASRDDSQQLTQLLSDANAEALALAADANETQALILNDENWVTHALMLAKVKGHVDNMAIIAEKLSKAEKSGSELQEQAVERVLPLVKELSANTTAAINYLNQNKARPLSETYAQYLQKNAESANQLSSMISALFEYEKSMTDIEKLKRKLTASEN